MGCTPGSVKPRPLGPLCPGPLPRKSHPQLTVFPRLPSPETGGVVESKKRKKLGGPSLVEPENVTRDTATFNLPFISLGQVGEGKLMV
ncbi:DUF4092 domain-containing protein, partial [Escherichia coli]|nr:DUF4092 domain-containing protein [Escherichia coli]